MSWGSFFGGMATGIPVGQGLGKQWRDRKMRDEIAEAMKERQAELGAEDEALWQSDLSDQQRRMLQAQTGDMETSRVGLQTFSTPTEAKAYADQYNSMPGRMRRTADIYNKYGYADKAMGLHKDLYSMEQSKLAAEREGERLAMEKARHGQAQTLFEQQQAEQGRKTNYRDAYNAMQWVTDPKDRDVGLRAVHGALGDIGAAEQFDAQRLQAEAAQRANEAQKRQDDEATAIMAYGRLRRGDVAGANALFNSKGTPMLIVNSGKTDKSGQGIYQVFDPATKKLVNAGTADQLLMQAVPYDKAVAIQKDLAYTAYLGRMPKSGGGSGSGGGVVITPAQQKQLAELNQQFYATDDPKAQANIARKLQALQNDIAIANKRFPSLSGLTREPKAPAGDMTFKDFATAYGTGDPIQDVAKFKEWQLMNMPVEDLAARLPTRSGGQGAPAAQAQPQKAVPRFNKSEWQLVEQPLTQSWRPGKWVYRNLINGSYMSEDEYKQLTK
jgi:hypothetical protein